MERLDTSAPGFGSAEMTWPLGSVSLKASVVAERRSTLASAFSAPASERWTRAGTTRSAPAPLNAFHKSPSAIIGHGDTMVLPDVPATCFEGEAEVAVVIGKKCSHVSEAEAMDYVFGYMNFIDGSARGLGPAANVFFQMKSRDTFAPIGPWLVTSDEIKDPLKLQSRL